MKYKFSEVTVRHKCGKCNSYVKCRNSNCENCGKRFNATPSTEIGKWKKSVFSLINPRSWRAKKEWIVKEK